MSDNERAVVLAARELANLEARRQRLKKAFAEKIIALDREIDVARQALRTFTDGGQEQAGPPRIMEPLLESLGARR